MTVEAPIVIVGTGRCGSTMLHRLMALHDDLAWLSTFNEVLPSQQWLSRFSSLYRFTSLSDRVRHLPFFPKPFEAYRFWEHYLPGFSRRGKPQSAEDVPATAIDPVRRAVAKVLRHQQKRRFLVKVTGWSRIAYFDRIFPNAVFVWLDREPRSVVSSWIQAGWLDVTTGPDEDGWQWGPVPELYRRVWSELGATPILSAALKIQMDLDDIRSNISQFPDRCLRICYKDLVKHPRATLDDLLGFCGLDWTPGFEQIVASMRFYDSSNKWQRYLTVEQAGTIDQFFERTSGKGVSWRTERLISSSSVPATQG